MKATFFAVFVATIFWCVFAAAGATFRGRGAWMLQTYWPLLVSTHRPVFKQATLFKHLPKNKT